MSSSWLPLILLLFYPVALVHINRNEYYTAAVYEHRPVLNLNPQSLVDRQTALRLMNYNLDIYEEQVNLASKQGVKIIVFPEDGIHGFNYSRASIFPFLEPIPNPEFVKWNPCIEPDKFRGTEVLNRLSCMARKGQMFLVANVPGKQLCNSSDPHCPSDGRYQFNTNVVFSSDGALISRYFKQNLYFESAFNVPPVVEHVKFETPFAGTFGILTCFDLLFFEPTVTLIEKYGIQQVVLPLAWNNQLPLLTAIQAQRAFATAFSINLLAPNIHSPSMEMTGSGIYTPVKSVYYHNMTNAEGKLIVAHVPVTASQSHQLHSGEFCKLKKAEHDCPFHRYIDKESFVFTEGEEDYHMSKVKQGTRVSDVFYAEMMYDNYTLLPLLSSKGELKVCHNSLCCYLVYQGTFNGNELYALGVFDGLHTVHGTYYVQVCTVVKCSGSSYTSCGVGVTDADSLINFKLWGNFSTKYIFPEILSSEMTLDLADSMGWENNYFFMSRSGMSSGLVTAALYGRWYSKDKEWYYVCSAENDIWPHDFQFYKTR
ncbi:biotinidase-like [Protopterus annectens]|uniref:biotinidase-like n=1 Tax=Protopterus annectens TaxID=7888 RepID=UPI001CFA0CAF|nr:biotinidase-like [Protopterus annectens]